jgi:hypothetical protein
MVWNQLKKQMVFGRWAVMLALLSMLLLSGTVFAQEEVPQPSAVEPPPALPSEPAAEVVDAPPAAEPVAPVEPAAEVPAPIEEAPAVETPVVETALPVEMVEPAIKEIASEDAALEAQPATEPAIQLVDAAGEALDMASQTSADLLTSGDPYWQAGGQYYSSVTNPALCYGTTLIDGTCFISTTPIQNAINLIAANDAYIPTNGKIFVEYGVYSDVVSIDGTAFPRLLALNGLIGVANGSGLFPTLTKSITISNMTGGFTLNGFNVTGGVTIKDSSDQFIIENVTAPLTMTHVHADGNTGEGIKVTNHKGNIALTNVTANNNSSTGILVYTNLGSVTLNGVIANNNGGDGFNTQAYGVTIRNTVARENNNGLNIFLKSGAGLLENVVASDNRSQGVVIDTTSTNLGAVTLKNMTADNNWLRGIQVNSLGAVTVTKSDTNNNYNSTDVTGGDGLYISTKGAVTLTSIWSSGNGGNGLKVEGVYSEAWNADLGQWVNVSMLSPTSVTLTSPADSNFANFFSNNGQLGDTDIGANGIYIISERPVTIRNFTALDNESCGLRVTGPTLRYVEGLGFDYRRSGAVTITSTIPGWRNTADRNFNGVDVDSTGAVSLTGLNTNENDYAISIDTLGAITLRDVRDWGSLQSNAVNLINDGSSGYMPVTISNLEIRETRMFGDTALKVASRGAISISNLWLENDKSMGAYLKNDESGRGSITLNNATINNNQQGGIRAESNGAILFTKVQANWNGSEMPEPGVTYFGADLFNAGAPTAMPVTLTDCVFEGNQGTGLQILSKGVITLRGVESRWNNVRYGFMLNGQAVFETNQPWWNGFQYEGFDEWSFYYGTGDVTVTLRALWGFEPIVELVNSSGDTITADSTTDSEGIWTSNFNDATLLDTNTYTIRVLFDDTVSNGYGPYALSINNEDESDPFIPADGAVLDNTASITATPAGVVVSPTTARQYTFEGNNGYGLNIKTRGAVTLTNMLARDNSFGDGLYMNNPNAVGAVTVQSSLTDSVSFNNNGGNGLFIRTRGAIKLANVEAFNNRLSGADLDNAICTWDDVSEIWTNCLGSGGIILSAPSGKTRWFNDNQHFGIWALSRGSITLTNISAVNNGYDGAFLRNNRGGSSAPVSVGTLGVVRNEFSNNGWNTDYPIPSNSGYYTIGANGLSSSSGGTITVLNSSANSNQNDGGGFMLNSSKSVLPKTVQVRNVEAYGNDWIGVWVGSKGTITLTNVTVSDNGYEGGIHLDNCLDSLGVCGGSGGVSITTITANNNGSIGLDVDSKGLITLNGAWVNNNGGQGISLVNNYTPSIAGITMTAITANDNQGGGGVEALSMGFISLKGAEARNNAGEGIHLENKFDGAVAGISIISATANDNRQTGISAQTNGELKMTSLAANNNAMINGGISDGETVQDFYNSNKGPDNWKFDATAGKDYTFTLLVDSGIALNRMAFDPRIELIDPNAEDGWNHPLDISSDESPISVKLACITNTSCTFTFDPDEFGYSGMNTLVVRLDSLIKGDGFYRLSLIGPDPVSVTNQYWVNGLGFYAGGNVTLSGNNSFNGNSLTGIMGQSKGNISLANVGAFNNGTEGIYLDNTASTTNGSITITGTNIANNNGWEGLRIETLGIVSVSNLDASYNNYRDELGDLVGTLTYRASVRIHADGVGKTVTLANVTALRNGLDGLVVLSNGITTFNNVRAWLNGKCGAAVDSNGHTINVLFSTFLNNDAFGFFYVDYPTIIIPTGSIFWGNGGDSSADLYHLPPAP